MATAETVKTLQDAQIQQRTTKLARYLDSIVAQELVARATADQAWHAWDRLRAALGDRLPVPDACPGPDGQLLLAWERSPHYLELEVFPAAPAEFFYRNESSGDLWETDYDPGNPVPAEAIAKLALFA